MSFEAPARPPVRRHHGLVRLCHWLNALLLVGMIGSGLQIYGAYAHFGPPGDPFPLPNPWDGTGVPAWARLGGWLAGGLNRHFGSPGRSCSRESCTWPFSWCPASGARSSSVPATCGPRGKCSASISGCGRSIHRRASTTRSRRRRTRASWPWGRSAAMSSPGTGTSCWHRSLTYRTLWFSTRPKPVQRSPTGGQPWIGERCW